jgi:transcriptional antiterminator RfaH
MSNRTELHWQLLYTKPRAETWVEINLRTQGFATLLPRVRQRSGVGALFPRYIFAGFPPGQSARPMASTRGALYVVHCGERPARVPTEVIDELRRRMDAHGVVRLDAAPDEDALFVRQERERTRALVKLAQAGFRVRAA